MITATRANLPAARDWAHSASVSHIARAHRLVRVATAKSDPMVMLRMLFRAWQPQDLQQLVATCFGGTPTRACVQSFLEEVVAARPHVTTSERCTLAA